MEGQDYRNSLDIKISLNLKYVLIIDDAVECVFGEDVDGEAYAASGGINFFSFSINGGKSLWTVSQTTCRSMSS